MKSLRKIFLAFLMLGIHLTVKPCTPIPAPTLLSQSIVGNSLALNYQSNTTWVSSNCNNVIDVEIACFNNPFTGATYATFTTAILTITTSLMIFPTFYIDMTGWCPGTYKFRARERNTVTPPPSPWTSTSTFLIPGAFNPPTLSLQSSNLNICPPQSTTLTAIVNVDCGLPPYTYSWTGPTNMSCYTCSNPIVSPTITTTYTVVVTGGQLSCWTVSNTITIFIGPVPPVIGPASAYPPTVCSGSTTIIGLAFYNGNIQWQTSPTANGPWSNVVNGVGYNVSSPPLTSNIFYRAMVQGCLTLDSSNVVPLVVYPNPTVTVASVLICPAQTATLVASGASVYYWSSGSFPTGANTGGASPLTTTAYTVTGDLAGCTATALVTVSVGATPLVSVSDQTVCYNQNINLLAGGPGTTFDWRGPLGYMSSVQNPTIVTAQPQYSGGYTVTATSAIGCTNSAVSNITVLSVITPTIHSNNPVCKGSALNFTAAGANSFTWSGPGGFNTTNPNPVINNVTYAEGGLYTLTGGIGLCTGSSNIFIIIKTPPNPIAQNNSPACDGFPVAFSALGGVTYTWSGPSGFVTTAQNPTVANMYINNAGDYTVAVTGTNNCMAWVATNVTVNPLPLIPVNNRTICLNSPINLTSGGGTIYSWKGPNNFTSSLQNPVIPNSVYSLSGQYSVTVVSALGCSNTAQTSVTVVSVPSPVITSTAAICAGSTLSLLGSGGTTYTWTGPGNFASNLQNPLVNNIAPVSSGFYSLSVTVGICSTMISKSITVLPLPVLTIGTQSVCETKSLQLTATGGASNQWYTPGGVYSQSPSFVIPYAALSHIGNYTVVATGLNSCVSTSVLAVVVHVNPIVTAKGATVCAGLPATIYSGGGVAYQWNGPGYSSSSQNAFIPSVNANTIGFYTITVMGANSCTTAVPVGVSLIPIPQPSVIVTPTVCFNSEVRLEALGGLSYRWEGPYNYLSTKQITTFTASSMGLSGIYTLSAVNNSGCIGFTTTAITVFPIPEGLLVNENDKHCVPFCSDFAFASKYSTPLVNVNWQVNNQNFSTPKFNYCFFEPGNYIVTGDFGDANGCVNTSTFLIVAHETPRADFLFMPQTQVETVDEVVFRDNSTGNSITKWNWSFVNNGGHKSDQPNTSYYFAEAGIYPVSLVVKNIWNCADTIVKPMVIEEDFNIFVPNAFTPNEDGRNEIFQPKGRGVVKYQLMIYDRWGEKVFETKDFTESWDGSFRGKACKEEVYQWRIIASDRTGKVKDLWGQVTLYR